jgi:elongator complex protein 3
MSTESACREIISLLLDESLPDHNLRRIVGSVCKKYRLPSIPRHSDILAAATDMERERLLPLLRVKPSRTLSGVAPVAVMTSPAPCPHGKCLPCPGGPDHPYHSPQSYTGGEPAARRAFLHQFDPYEQTMARLAQFEQLGHHIDKAELIIMGGTITSREVVYQDWFTVECVRAMNEYDPAVARKKLLNYSREGSVSPEKKVVSITGQQDQAGSPAVQPLREPIPLSPDEITRIYTQNETAKVRCVAITFETRPDWCRREDIDRMLTLGVTKVELGVQHLDDGILTLNRRGCTVADTVQANTLLRDAGLKVGFHIMPNLPGSSLDTDRKMFRELFTNPGFKPDFLKIYPTLVTPGAEIEELYLQGGYNPYGEDELIDLIADAKAEIDEYCRLQRIQRDIPADRILAGSRHSNFRELSKERLIRKGGACRCIRCREIGRCHSDEEVNLRTYPYECCGGKERFISYTAGDSLVGFVRLRFPAAPWRPETEGAAFVRELHVYGMVVPIGRAGRKTDHQHRRYGSELLAEAENQANDAGYSRITIMAGIGVRPYYRRLGYERSGPYMVRNL